MHDENSLAHRNCTCFAFVTVEPRMAQCWREDNAILALWPRCHGRMLAVCNLSCDLGTEDCSSSGDDGKRYRFEQ